MKKMAVFFCWMVMAWVLQAAPGDADWFPIMAWGTNQHHRPGNAPLSVERFREMAECGINIAGFALDRAELDMIHEAGLVAYFQDLAITTTPWESADPALFADKVNKMVADIGDHPALYGYLLGDEPRPSEFPNLQRMWQLIRAAAPDKDIYLNLFPNYVPLSVLKTASYREYVDRFLQDFQPDWVGYDFYALPEGREGLQGDFWLNLDEVRAASLQAGVPFQICTQGVGLANLRVPTEADLFFEIYSGLLYGARGIQIFTYFSPDLGNYRNAAISGAGAKTPVWHALKEISGTVRCLAPVLNQLQSQQVYHLPWVESEKGTRAPDAESLIADIEPGGEYHFAVGEFRTASGEDYVMILNKDLERSAPIGRIQWRKQPAGIQIVSQTRSGVLRNLVGEEYWIAPGRAVLLKVAF